MRTLFLDNRDSIFLKRDTIIQEKKTAAVRSNVCFSGVLCSVSKVYVNTKCAPQNVMYILFCLKKLQEMQL